MIESRALAVAATGLLTVAAQAQQLSTLPACPYPDSPFTARVAGWWPDACVPKRAGLLVGEEEIHLLAWIDPWLGCVQTVTWYAVDWPVTTQVPPGSYSVRYKIYAGTTLLQEHVLPPIVVSFACPEPCYPDCNYDGSLTAADFGCFQMRFAASQQYADCNGDWMLSIADFGCFQSRFVAGCP